MLHRKINSPCVGKGRGRNNGRFGSIMAAIEPEPRLKKFKLRLPTLMNGLLERNIGEGDERAWVARRIAKQLDGESFKITDLDVGGLEGDEAADT